MNPNADAPLEALRAILGRDELLSDATAIAPFLTDHRRLYHGSALAVAVPRTVEQISKLLQYCNRERIGIVPHGGNTSYCGGATPDESGRQLVLSLRRLNRVRKVEPLNYSLTVEAGCTLAAVQQAAEDADRLFPLSLGSEGSCQIGGNLATNAGGTSVVRYGMMRDLVLGVEVVLADGRVLASLSELRKDNTGYDTKSLFLGAEGTLGVITAASLKLFPRVRASATAFAAVTGVPAAVEMLGRTREASGDRVSSFELIPRIGIDLTTRHIPGVRDPLTERHEWYVLCELTSSRADDPLEAILGEMLTEEVERGSVLDAVLARSERERNELWKLRETIPEAQRLDGASLKHDLSLPLTALAAFVAEAARWLAGNVPDGRLVCYGHVGDGNLHFNLNQAPGTSREIFLARETPIKRVLHDMVHTYGGSFSAEHGIGRLKVAELERYAPATELDVMRALKQALDPNGILNPGKVLRGQL